MWPTSTCRNDENLEKVRIAISADRRRTIDEISEITGLSSSSCQRMLTGDLYMKHCFRKIYSSVVDRGSKNNHLNVCYDLRKQAGNDPQILSKVVTGDETWYYGYDPETKQASSQWKTANSPKAKKARQVRSNVKIMLISFFLC